MKISPSVPLGSILKLGHPSEVLHRYLICALADNHKS